LWERNPDCVQAIKEDGKQAILFYILNCRIILILKYNYQFKMGL